MHTKSKKNGNIFYKTKKIIHKLFLLITSNYRGFNCLTDNNTLSSEVILS